MGCSEPARHDQTARGEGRGRNWRRVRWAKVRPRLDRVLGKGQTARAEEPRAMGEGLKSQIKNPQKMLETAKAKLSVFSGGEDSAEEQKTE